jgi:PRC-barrel domain
MAIQERDSQRVATDETPSLISSDKVEGTSVYNRQGDKLGSIKTVMIDKVSGKVAYAVMSFGGFLGIGESYHPLPWRRLSYATKLGGYVVEIDARVLEEAPRYTASDQPDWSDPGYRDRIDQYWMVPSV